MVSLHVCFQSEEHQEYEYLLKWKGYGEEENSWVPASFMNCWDLLQQYLSKNIFNQPPTGAQPSSSFSLSSCFQRFPDGAETMAVRKSKHKLNGSVNNCQRKCTNRSKCSSKRTNRRNSNTVHVGKKVCNSLKKIKTKKRLCNSALGSSKASVGDVSHVEGGKQPLLTTQNTPQQAHPLKKALDLVSQWTGINGPISSPSNSPIISSFEELSSSQSDCGTMVNDNFHLFLDTDEESSSFDATSSSSSYSSLPSGNHSQAHALSLLEQRTSCGLLEHCLSVSQQKNLNGHKTPSQPFLCNGVKSSAAVTSNEIRDQQEFSPQAYVHVIDLTTANLDGVSPNLPSSTTGNGEGSSSESWSRCRLRKRQLSASPPPETNEVDTNITSTSSPPLPPVPRIQPRASSSPEYQQELLEWQFLLNKQCRPAEAFILIENRMDEAAIPWSFKYITKNIYGEGVPDPQHPDMAARLCGCACYITGKRCSPKVEYCCAKQAGGEFPYTIAGKVRLPPGNPIYECNSCCSCPADCTNRVVQHGRKVNMCIFRTSNGRGWGVKTMEPIKPNTFVTEYVGEVVTTEEAERRGQLYDEEGRTYLFDLDFNCDDNAFTIDAAHYGNISHFFNHSVSVPDSSDFCDYHTCLHCAAECILCQICIYLCVCFIFSPMSSVTPT